MEIIRYARPVARKTYNCNACEWVINALGDVCFEMADMRTIVKARRAKWKIQPGERYLMQVQKDYGDIVTVRCKIDIDAICHKYDLYDYDW